QLNIAVFLNVNSDESFAKELIDYLFKQNKKNSLCLLCGVLENEIEIENLGEDVKIDFRDFREKVCNLNNSLNNNKNSSISLKERQYLIDKVSESRVDPFIKNNELINEELIPIGLEKLPRVRTPQEKELLEREGRLVDEPPQKLGSGTKIINIFDQMGNERTLLILGEPGSGKTTILAELTKELSERAKTDNNLPIPVILNLSSWKESQSIDKWIVKRLTEFYKVPKDKGRLLVSNQELLLLIDGFDEIKSEYQNFCVEELLNFINKNEEIKIVICSRTGIKREELLEKLTSRIAVRLQFLSEEEAYGYLDKEDSVPTDFKDSIKKEDELRKIIIVPLFLYLIIDIYKSKKSQDTVFSLEGGTEKIRNKIFYKYIEKELNKWKGTRNHPKEKVENWLIWLAKQMNQESLEAFLIEKLQPKWLSLPPEEVTKLPQDASVEVGEAEGEKKDLSEPYSIQKIMYRTGVRLIVGLLCGLSCGLLSETLNYDPNTNFLLSLISHVIFGLISGLLSGLLLGLISLWLEYFESSLISWLPKIDDKLIRILRFVLIGFIFGLIRWGVSLLIEQDKIQPLDAIIFGGLSGFIFSYRLNCQKIETVERIEFYPQYFIRNLRFGMLIGFLSGITMLSIGIVAELIKDDNTPFINSSIRDTLKGVMTLLVNPWLMNFLKKAVEPLIINEKPDILGYSILCGVLAFGLLLGLNLWVIVGWRRIKVIFRFKRIQRRNGNRVNRTHRSILPPLFINLIISSFVSLLFVYFSFTNKDIILWISSFCQKLNVLWGVLTLEVFVGLQVGIGLGFRRNNKIESATEPNYGIITTFLIRLGFRRNNKIESATEPNYGIITTRRNAGEIFLISGLISGCVSTFFWWIYSKHQEIIWWIFYKTDDNGIIFGSIVGLMVGLLSGLVNGGNSGLVCIKHFVLRVILCKNKWIPWNYASFLNEAARGLLIQTGGSYRFRHGMLREHLADMPLEKRK
ncbi:NACHT domain-containing NTPase, partial [Nostoc sp. CHAB 5715]|uniref:NACHT domain-containing protein n=1 Tax=Nostoc sp. CHAB 5715 TaxID=2780400 RepID=UPI001E56A3CC